MKKIKSIVNHIGIWMDHAEARIINPDISADKPNLIRSSYKSRIRIAGENGDGTQLGNNRSTNNESHKHFRKQNDLHSYY